MRGKKEAQLMLESMPDWSACPNSNHAHKLTDDEGAISVESTGEGLAFVSRVGA